MDPEPGAPNLGERLDELLYRWDELRRRPSVVASAVTLALLCVGGAWWITQRGGDVDAQPIDDRIPVVSLAPAVVATTAPTLILVHVTGAVHTPGVYELDQGSRVLDAISLAGGPEPDGQPDRLNLAAPVADGMQIRVPIEGEPAVLAGPDDPSSVAGPVDLNSATAAQLEGLPGVGPATATAILDYRDEIGRFGSVSDLLGVRGIGEAKLDALRDLVIVR